MKEPCNKMDTQLALIEAIKSNDSVALKSLYTANYYKVETMIIKNSGSREHAKDIYQEAFITLWKNVKNDLFIPQSETALQGYLYQIAKNKWMDLINSKTFKKTTVFKNEQQITASSDSKENADHEAQLNEKIENMMKLFKEMGQPCKGLLTAFYFDKKSLRTIAADFKIEENTARNNKYRCMEKLRKMILQPK